MLAFRLVETGVRILRISCLRPCSQQGWPPAIGSLPHRDAGAAAALVLRCLPELPAAPQLPHRSRARGSRSRSGCTVSPASTSPTTVRSQISGDLDRARIGARRAATPTRTPGLLAFVDAASALPRAPKHVKAQVTGPLDARRRARARWGRRPTRAFALGDARGARVGRSVLERYFAARMPGSRARAVLRRARARAVARATTRRSIASSPPTSSRPRSPRRRA